MTALRLPLFREITALLLLLALMLQSATAVAPGPAWWNTQNVLDPYSVADDFAVANVGQLKYMAAKAAAAMEAALPGGAGEPINTMVSDWSLAPASGVTRDNYLAINQGQLKHVAAPFYVRLGLPYPWAGGSAVKDNYKLVNLGQLKYVFSFALNSRTAGQGAVQIPTAMLTAALAQWQALPVKPVGSSTDDFDGDGIPNLQEYLMNSTLFDPLDIDGDRILDSVEDAHPGVLSKLRFADAVADYDGDGVMNFEEVLLGLNLTSATTSGRVDAMSDAKVLAWGLAARKPLVDSVVAGTDALKTFWGQIDAAWITANVGNDYLNWLDATVVNGVAKGLTAFRTDVLTNHVWEPWNPGAAGIGGTPSVFHDANGNTIDMDGDSVPDFDRDADYLPDLWEYRYALNLRDSQDATKDPDGDLLTNLQEYQAGTNPRLADSDGDGFADKAELVQLAQGADPLNGAAGLPLVLVLASGNFQTVTAGGGSAPLVIHVTQGGLPVSGAQVQFAVGTGGGSLRAANVAAATGTPVSMTTDANGTASAVYLAAASTGTAGVTATLGSSSGGSSVNFSLTIAEASVTYAYESSNAAPFGGVVGAFGAGNVPRNNPFEEPTLLADSKYMNAAWEKWTDAAAKQFYKSYGNIGHSWDSGHSGVIFPATQTDQTDQIVKRFNAEPSRYFSSANESGLLQGLGEIATYQHFYNKTTDGSWYQPTSESEVQYRRVTALKVVTYVPQKVPAEMTFLALVYLGDSGWLPNSGDPRGTLLASGVIRVKGSASSWSPSLEKYCKRDDGAVVIDPGPEGERLIAKTENKHIRVELLRVDITEVFERDQKWNKVPNPKTTLTYANEVGWRSDQLPNVLFVSVEPTSSKAELSVKTAVSSMLEDSPVYCCIVNYSTKKILPEVAVVIAGSADLTFTPDDSIHKASYEVRLGIDKNKDGAISMEELIESSSPAKKMFVRVVNESDYTSAMAQLDWWDDTYPLVSKAKKFLRFFDGNNATLIGATPLPPKKVHASDANPTHIAGSTYSPTTGDSLIPSYKFVDGTDVSDAVEDTLWSSTATGFGLYEVVRVLFWNNKTSLLTPFILDSSLQKSTSAPIKIAENSEISFYGAYLSMPDLLRTFGGAHFKNGGTVIFALSRSSSDPKRIYVESITIDAVIEDLYDFDWTRGPETASRMGATVQLTQPSSRKGGRIFFTETEIKSTYTDSALNPLDTISKFNYYNELKIAP